MVGKGAKVGEENDELKISVLGRDISVSDKKTVKAGDIIDESI